MLEAMINTGILLWVLGILMTIGVLAKVISYITVRKLVRAASEIQKSNHRFMRLLKAKFEHASMVSDKVQNVEAFVQKYLYEYKVLGARLDTWRGLQRKMIWFVLAFGLFGMFGVYQTQGMDEAMFRYGSFAAIYAVILFSIHILGNEQIKIEAAKNYMVDYLENVCLHRYEKANQGAVEAKTDEVTLEAANEEELPKAAYAETKETSSETEQEREREYAKQREEQQMRIRAILEEFLA